MATPNWNQRFLVSTRGRILSLLRRGGRTVNELADATGLTDNAVRAHLATLERDALVQATGTRPGTRKPNVVYELAPAASQVFPKPYAATLREVLEVLAGRLSAADLEEVLRATGQSLAANYRLAVRAGDVEGRIREALAVFEELGGLADVEERGGQFCIQGFDCPLGAAATPRRQVCRIAEAMLTELLGMPVHERCGDGSSPGCYFEVTPPPGETG